jgi:hypothetical protein
MNTISSLIMMMLFSLNQCQVRNASLFYLYVKFIIISQLYNKNNENQEEIAHFSCNYFHTHQSRYIRGYLVFTASAEVSITYVSSTLNSFTSAQGSKGGGTVLYIAGVNFSPIADDIQIYFGNYPCNLIAEGSTVSMVSCITTPMYDPNAQYSIPITMYTANLLPVTCRSNVCLFSYSNNLTPFIYEVFPSTFVGNEQISIDGVHRISNIGDGRSPSASDLRYILIGDTSCSTLDIIQDTISSNSANVIYCNTFLYQEAGEYNMVERVVYGDAQYSVDSVKTSFFTGVNYTVRVAPVF